MFIFAYTLINTIMVGILAVALRNAPEGYEDELGFHFIKRTLPLLV
jgi:hypothetical protein